MANFNEDFQNFMGGSSQPTNTSFKDSYSQFLSSNTYAKSNPLAPSPTPTAPVQITPDAKKVDLSQIGNTISSTAKSIFGGVKLAESVIGGLKFLLQPAKELQKIQLTQNTKPVTETKPKEVPNNKFFDTIQKSILSGLTNKSVASGVATGVVNALPKQTQKNLSIATNTVDIVKGFFGEHSAINPYFPDNADVNKGLKQFSPKNNGEQAGKFIYGLIRDLTVGELGGINTAFENTGKSIASEAGKIIKGSNFIAPKIGYVQNVLNEFASREFNNFMRLIKPINLTFKDFNDIQMGKATAEQLAKYNRAVQIADQTGISLQKMVADSKNIKVNPLTKIHDFIAETVDKLTQSLKGSLTKEEQLLLESGIKKDISNVIKTGEHTPQDLISSVMSNGLEKTPEGKQVIKMVAEAQNTGQNIIVNKLAETSPLSPALEGTPTRTAVGTPSIKGGEVIEPPQVTKTAEVPRENLPVGEGKVKVSRLEARVTDNLKAMSQEQINQLGLPTYKQMNKKENIASAVDYVTKNPDEAIKVLNGDIEAPKGILRNSIYVAMENMAVEDASLARRMASLSNTRLGQELSILTEINPDSPVKIMKDIIDVREKAFEGRFRNRPAKEIVKKYVEKGKAMIKPPAKTDWASIIREVRC